MKISIITAVYNNKACIGTCLDSVAAQRYPYIEHIVVDGGSTDGTLDIVKTRGQRISRLVSGPDKGIYDALNKGIGLATGEAIGFLHSDDVYENSFVIESVASFLKRQKTDSCYGDLLYVSNKSIEKVIRYWRSGTYREGLFKLGWMPPHPTFFVRRGIYEKYGVFNLSLGSAADYEMMLRLLEKCRISTGYIPEVLVRMRTGGASNKSFLNRIRANRMDGKAWEINGLKPYPGTLFMKPLRKLGQFVNGYITTRAREIDYEANAAQPFSAAEPASDYRNDGPVGQAERWEEEKT